MQCSPSILDPVGFRWKMESSAEDGLSLPIDWMDGKPAPEAVLERLACSCPKSFIQTFRPRLQGERPNMSTDLC